MKKNLIFLSYRRDDSPGYVSRLEDELERVFGKGRVFRDATDIAGGAKWKNVIDANLHCSAVLILVIGPRWEKIWLERIDDEVNHVALELLRAKELDVPVFPVTLDGTQLSKGLDLGGINFIYENQFHDISDKQGRWSGDVQRLVSLLESVPGIGSPDTAVATTQQPPTHNSSRSWLKWLLAVASLLIVAAVGYGIYTRERDPVSPKPFEQVIDINGTWQFKDGTLYILQQNDDGTFRVESPGKGSGQARYIDNMPGKLAIEMPAIGRGEFSGFDDGTALGWFIFNGSSQQFFGSLVRVE